MAEVRVRIAPSPTGKLHIGTARVALFNYLFARQQGGKFILRVEDTDRERSKDEFDKEILDGLEWLGLVWDEGPRVGGEYGPYYQKERLDIYRPYLEKLLQEGRAYRCFCMAEELANERQAQEKTGQPPRYSGRCRHLSSEEVAEKTNQGVPCAIRLKVEPGLIKFNDLIRGQVEWQAELFGDIVLARADGMPLFLFTNVVDDYLMKISHVLRGEDHITNTFKQILIYEALGLPLPQFGHLPMILNHDRSKMSKRRDPVSINDDYRQKGYLPEALVNFIALLGWAPGKDREIMNLEEMTKLFDVKRVGKSPSIFDPAKLLWMNGYYMRQLSDDELVRRASEFVKSDKLAKAIKTEPSLYNKALKLAKDRLKTLCEVEESIDFFFFAPPPNAKLLAGKSSNEDAKQALKLACEKLAELEEFSAQTCEEILRQASKDSGRPAGELLWTVRAALTGKEASPGAFEMLEALGKEESLRRLETAERQL